MASPLCFQDSSFSTCYFAGHHDPRVSFHALYKRFLSALTVDRLGQRWWSLCVPCAANLLSILAISINAQMIPALLLMQT
jgi:hypothetical protein